MSKEFGLDGKPWDKPHHIPPLILIEEKTEEYEPGWYHCNEVEQIEAGPFNTWQEAAEAFREYCKTL